MKYFSTFSCRNLLFSFKSLRNLSTYYLNITISDLIEDEDDEDDEEETDSVEVKNLNWVGIMNPRLGDAGDEFQSEVTSDVLLVKFDLMKQSFDSLGL